MRVNSPRLQRHLTALANIGRIEGDGVKRLALSEPDREARDLLVQWMHALNLNVTVDRIGNIIGVQQWPTVTPPVMIGSHIDSVSTGGRFDGTLGVLAGLEVIERLSELGVTANRPIAVGSFTNEEGARFAPDMMGSAVHQGSLALEQALSSIDSEGTSVREGLANIGYDGEQPVPATAPHAFVELHIEQGPVLEREGIAIGAVTGVQGISWTQYTINGVSNHAGTTPMSMRCDAGYVAGAIAFQVREIAAQMGGAQVATVGAITLEPNLVNVIARRAVMTVDLRNIDEQQLAHCEAQVSAAIHDIVAAEGATFSAQTLARFEPVAFDTNIVSRVASLAGEFGHSVRQMPSGAGHDAQMFAPNCPTGMIFVPSRGGISHNVEEFTEPAQIEAGANILLNLVYDLASA
jgi:N-carbamoyl-L-amino-acid hydrolase